MVAHTGLRNQKQFFRKCRQWVRSCWQMLRHFKLSQFQTNLLHARFISLHRQTNHATSSTSRSLLRTLNLPGPSRTMGMPAAFVVIIIVIAPAACTRPRAAASSAAAYH